MRFYLFFFSIIISYFANGQTLDSLRNVRFDGFYQTISDIDKQDNDTTYSYLRFYSDGKVINVTSEGTAFDLKEWFNLKMDNASLGNYERNGKRLYFSTTSKAGTIIYRGKIKDQYHLILKSKSLINGYKVREKFYFVAIHDLR